ncbi:DUF1990 family protein [Glutamicibacter sp. NPDC087344]|uniref:DUF1990 family protein n=1 Tax=Glutamicibacter sp. NPDC087344 TaxID=3363994 RepID=UPI00380B2901
MSLTQIHQEQWNVASDQYRVWQQRWYLGLGEDFWAQSVQALLRWEVKTRSGFRLTPQEKVSVGARPVITVPVGPFTIHEPVEVSDLVDQANLAGFAYRTLPGHPVSGEEAFILQRQGPAVFLEIRSLTTASDRRLWRILFPLLLLTQKLVRRRYRRALRQQQP